MNMAFWHWLILGAVPYWIKWEGVKGGWTLKVWALVWLVVLHFQRGTGGSWTFRSPLIERLSSAFWTIIIHHRKNEPPQEEE